MPNTSTADDPAMSAERAVDVATINTINDSSNINGQQAHSGAGTILDSADQGYGDLGSSRHDRGEGRESHQRLVASTDRYPPQSQSQSQLESGSDLPTITMSSQSSDLAPAIPAITTSVPAGSHTASEPPFNLQIAELIPNNDTTNINTNKYNNKDALDLEPIDVKHPIIHVDSPRSSLEREKGEIKHRALEPVMEGPKVSRHLYPAVLALIRSSEREFADRDMMYLRLRMLSTSSSLPDHTIRSLFSSSCLSRNYFGTYFISSSSMSGIDTAQYPDPPHVRSITHIRFFTDDDDRSSEGSGLGRMAGR